MGFYVSKTRKLLLLTSSNINSIKYVHNSYGKIFYMINPFTWINNRLKENYIKSNYENDFDLKIFCLGARQAFLLISKYLSQNKYDELKPYVSQKCIVELKQKNTNFDQEIIKELACNEENIYLSYPYKVMYKEDQNVLNCDINVIFCIMKLIYENKTPVKNMFGQLNLSFNRKFKLNQVTEWIISDIEIKKLAYF
ncbi:unnamed protein product [Gordionus sp. m RMFG-2023]